MRVLLLLLLLSQISPGQQTTSISGFVRDDLGRPIANARVTISNQLMGSQIDFYTQRDGGYRVSGLEPLQDYSVEVSHHGFLDSHKHLIPRAGPPVEVHFEMVTQTGFSMPAAGTLWSVIFSTLVTTIVAASVTLLFTEPGKKLIEKAGKAGAWIWDKTYEMLAPRLPNAVGLRGYRKRVQRSSLARIEHPVGPGDSDGVSLRLDRAFVPLAVMTGDGEDRVDLFPFTVAHPRFMVLGGPGTGKTTLMKSIIISTLRRSAGEGLNTLIPIFVVLREMSSNKHSVEQALAAVLA